MEQGFTASEFAPSAAAEKAQSAMSRATRGGHAPKTPHNPEAAHSAAEAMTKGVSLYGDVAKGERKAEEAMRGVQSKLMMPGMLQFGGMIAATPLMWVAGKVKLPKVKAVIGSVLKATSTALDTTKITELGQLPANYMNAVAEQAKEAGVATWEASAAAKSVSLKVSGAAAQGKAAEFAKPLTGAISGAFEKLGQSSFVKALPSVVKSSLGKVRGASVFQVLMTAGVAVGMGATLVGSRAEKKETKVAFDNLVADMGGDANSPFAKAVQKTYTQKKKWGVGKTGLELAGGVLEGVMWAKPGFGGMGMMGAMMVPQICQSLVPDSPTLGAHAALAKADAGELKIDAAARAELWKQMIVIVPNVAANGGEYNRLTAPIAKEMVARNFTAKQGVQLLSDEAAFMKFAGEVSAKQPAVAKSVTLDSKVAAKPIANAPSLKIAGTKMHQGTVVENQRQVG